MECRLVYRLCCHIVNFDILWSCTIKCRNFMVFYYGRQEGHPACENWVVWCWHGVCLEQGADLHVAQLMPLPLTVSCFSKIQIGLPFWYRLIRVVPEKEPGVCMVLYYMIVQYCYDAVSGSKMYCSVMCSSIACCLIQSFSVWFVDIPSAAENISVAGLIPWHYRL